MLSPIDVMLARFVGNFHAARVLVVGDVILDRYVSGSVRRLSPEAPIPVLRPTSNRCTLGGAANVALNIAALGGQAILIGVIGSDAAAIDVERLTDETPGISPALVRIANRPTTSKTRFITGSHQLLRLDEETTSPLDATGVMTVLDALERWIANADIIVLSDYAKGVLCDDVLGAILSLSGQLGKIVIADPKRPDFAAYRGATILTPNEHEVRIATRMEAEHDAEADRAGRIALDVIGGAAVLVTRSANGLTLVRRDGDTLHLPTRAREVADVSGAGDTLVAALSVALGSGAALQEAAMLANATAGISVGKQGTATVSRKELLDVLHLNELATADCKVAGLDEAQQRVAEWHRCGLTVGFANGCFDLVHPGHVHLLRGARGLRPAGRRAEHGRICEAFEGADPAAAERDRESHGDGIHVIGRSRHPVRRRYPVGNDPGTATQRAGEGLGLHQGPGGRERSGQGLGRESDLHRAA